MTNHVLLRTAASSACLAALLSTSIAQGNVRQGNQGRMVRYAVGHYTDSEKWSRRGQTFALRYTLDLDQSRKARLTVAPEGDRNEPTDRRDKAGHGTILEYLHSGHKVTQLGTWSQQSNVVTVHFDRIQYGRTDRSKSETLIGHLKGSSIFTTVWDKSFYGHDAKLSFETS